MGKGLDRIRITKCLGKVWGAEWLGGVWGSEWLGKGEGLYGLGAESPTVSQTHSELFDSYYYSVTWWLWNDEMY